MREKTSACETGGHGSTFARRQYGCRCVFTLLARPLSLDRQTIQTLSGHRPGTGEGELALAEARTGELENGQGETPRRAIEIKCIELRGGRSSHEAPDLALEEFFGIVASVLGRMTQEATDEDNTPSRQCYNGQVRASRRREGLQ